MVLGNLAIKSHFDTQELLSLCLGRIGGWMIRNNGSDQLLSSPDAISRRGKRRTPPKLVLVELIVLCLIGIIIRSTDILGDHVFANFAVLFLGIIAFSTMTVWFLFFSGFGWRLRLLVLTSVFMAVSLFAVLFRIERLSGELIPYFAYRFSLKPDRRLHPPRSGASAGVNSTSVDLRTTTENDFPQFLGPRRSDSVEHVRLARNWTDRPPQLVWRHEIGAGWSAFSVVNGHAVTMEQRGDWEMVTCYGLETGRLEWANSNAIRFERLEAGIGPRSTPTIDDGMVYAIGALGHLVCLDGTTGKCIWEKDLLKEYGITAKDEAAGVPWGRAGSPLVVGDRVIVPVGGRKGGSFVSLAAYDKRRGTLLWKGGDRQISYSSPAVAILAGAEQILSVNEDTVSGHDVNTGRPLWEQPWKGHTNADPNVSQPVPILPNLVFISKGYGQGAMLLRLGPGTGDDLAAEVVWKNTKVLKTKFTNVAILGNYVYGLSDGVLECVDLTDGQSKWKQGRYGHGQILLVNDLLLVLSEEGEIVLVDATPESPNKVMGRFQALDGLTWNNFALSGTYLLVRNAEEAACYRLPLEEPH
jgi:outer membrane protein assembly factor BamB